MNPTAKASQMRLNKLLKAVIVEDEEAPRQLLKRQLQRRHADVLEVVGEAATGPDALVLCESLQPDVIFLDLDLPGAFGGFELLSQLRMEPHVVITTASAEHAVEAYRANAVDYLLKPIDPERLGEAVSRITSAISSERLVRLLCRDKDDTKIVHLDDVLFLCAEDGYTKVQTSSTYYLVPDPLAALAERLPDHFVRIHRNTIVNIRHASVLDNESVRMGQQGHDLAISRRHLRDFRRKLMFEK